ncbi:hypothetical protein GCM10027395_20830 [Giesbergeria sinuosa]
MSVEAIALRVAVIVEMPADSVMLVAEAPKVTLGTGGPKDPVPVTKSSEVKF